MRSDARIFNSDNKAEISRLAASANDFDKTCSRLMEKMVNTVPKAVKLSAPIMPMPVKPISLFATVNTNDTITFTETIRVRNTIFILLYLLYYTYYTILIILYL